MFLVLKYTKLDKVAVAMHCNVKDARRHSSHSGQYSNIFLKYLNNCMSY